MLEYNSIYAKSNLRMAMMKRLLCTVDNGKAINYIFPLRTISNLKRIAGNFVVLIPLSRIKRTLILQSTGRSVTVPISARVSALLLATRLFNHPPPVT